MLTSSRCFIKHKAVSQLTVDRRKDALSNMILACPNHHRAIHRCDAPFDAEAVSFVFERESECLILLKHKVAPN